MKPLPALFLALLLAAQIPAAAQLDRSLRAELEQLDDILRTADEYTSVREGRIAHFKDLLDAETSPVKAYDYARRLYEEHFAYNLDAALSYGNLALEYANAIGDEALIGESHLAIAKLYTVAGMYAEALGSFSRLDVASLAEERLAEYYLTCNHFNRDFMEYSKDLEMAKECATNLAHYRRQLYELPRDIAERTPNYTRDSLSTRLLDLYDSQHYEEALHTAEQLLALSQPTEHTYAIAAYFLSMVYERLGDTTNQALWLIRSAAVDTRLAIKDTASLCMLASLLSADGDIERAFRYIRRSTDDAIFYNAKLRQWQVAIRMNTIEQDYHNGVSRQQKMQRRLTIMASFMAAILLAVCIYVVMLLRRTSRAQRQLRAKNDEVQAVNDALKETNRQLSQLNLSIAEANMVKEEYIGLFLSMCSDYIDKIASMQRRVRKGIMSGSISELNREFPSNDIIEAEKEHFYEVFDSAFLNLYPNFVEEFNSLLDDEGQIELKKGERLNTELRIFALIRLGITDSSKIALLLHYSVNTIYNYRAKVKNRARGNRDDFEQVIRTIGSFKS